MEKIEKSHHMQKCFWYVIFTGLMMIYDEWAPHRPIISTRRGADRSNKVSSFKFNRDPLSISFRKCYSGGCLYLEIIGKIA